MAKIAWRTPASPMVATEVANAALEASRANTAKYTSALSAATIAADTTRASTNSIFQAVTAS